MAQQHLERALAIRERCHGGANSLKVAETLNSLALVSLARGVPADALQLRSMQALFDSAEPEDIESEDVPWEVYKRLKQQRGPSTARNSVTFLKDTMRKRVLEVVGSQLSLSPIATAARQATALVAGPSSGDSGGSSHQALANSPLSPETNDDALAVRRAVRSQSDSGAMKRYVAERSSTAAEANEDTESNSALPGHHLSDSLRIHVLPASSRSPAQQPTNALPAADVAPGTVLPPIRDFNGLQARVEGLKRRIAGGFPDTSAELAQFAADVDTIQALELRDVGFAMLSLVREVHRLHVKADAARSSLPVLEGLLEKKSASIFRGWEKRWFKVDSKTFVLSYHFSRDDSARGFAPRGGFPVARIASILVHRHDGRGSAFYFDVVVDLSTRLNPHAARTYELRCADQETLRYWVETLHHYKATAQTTPARPSTS